MILIKFIPIRFCDYCNQLIEVGNYIYGRCSDENLQFGLTIFFIYTDFTTEIQFLNKIKKTWVELFTDPHTSVEYSA